MTIPIALPVPPLEGNTLSECHGRFCGGNLESLCETKDLLGVLMKAYQLWIIFMKYLIIMKVGILGGGQLGRMLLQAAANYTVETFVLENDAECPSAHLCHHFTKGDITNFNEVYSFGKGLDAITIEIENVNIEALEKLAQEGVKVYPSPAVIRIIKNKIIQKQFYKDNEIPSPPFLVTQHKKELGALINFLPAVHKIAEGGYDGKGVQVLNDVKDFEKAFDAPSVFEKKIAIKKEIAMIIAMNDIGAIAWYPASEMMVNPSLNLLDYQISPAQLPEKVFWVVEAVAIKLVKALNSAGLFAVEMFVDTNDEVWVNETAPRVHNSGHHTIEANHCSQYDMLWRIILGFPLGNTAPILPAAIINIIGEENYTGTAVYEGLEEVLTIDNAFVHLYGKKQTRPGRKMGHVTVMHSSYHDLTLKANQVKSLLKVKS